MSIGGRKAGWVEGIVKRLRELPIPLHSASLTGTIQLPFDRQVTPTKSGDDTFSGAENYEVKYAQVRQGHLSLLLTPARSQRIDGRFIVNGRSVKCPPNPTPSILEGPIENR